MNEIKKINVGGVDYDIVAKELTKTTYTELKALRDNGQLSEGHFYRITDYVTTTTQAETKSAGNVFDVIVLAISTHELSHNARAIQHEGDTFFDGNDLGAWELWYDLDNDTEKYEWADAINGKGVIYRMIDDKANDCPYDFKNILFYNTVYTDIPTKDKYYYTFSYVVFGNQLYDGSVEKRVNLCSYNSMGVRMSSNKMGLSLLFNVFRNTTFRTECHHNTFGIDCHHNTFRDGCNYNTFGTGCNYNTFGTGCHHNTFGHFRSGYKVDSAITMSEEFYDDGSGKLVPVKHPDLSTQPSILPYKFMGQYVYEQLIPKSAISHHGSFSTSLLNVHCSKILFLEVTVVTEGTSSYHSEVYGIIGGGDTYSIRANGETAYDFEYPYLRVVYTSMPEEGGYYGYNNY